MKYEFSFFLSVRVIEDNNVHKLFPPGDDKWDSNVVYIVTYPKGDCFFLNYKIIK